MFVLGSPTHHTLQNQHLYETEMSSSKGRDYFIGGVSGLG